MANNKLTWAELRKAVAQTANVSEQKAGQFLNAFLEAIIDGLKTDKQVKIKGIGTFALKAVAPRKSVNIATGETFIIEGYNKLTFNAEAMLKESVEKRIEQTKTKEIMADINPDPMRKLGEQANEIVDILADLGQAPTTAHEEKKSEETIAEIEETTENVVATVEPVAEEVAAEEETAEEEVIEEVQATEEEAANEEAEATSEVADTNTETNVPIIPKERPAKPTCKCHKWICWAILAAVLIGLITTGLIFRNEIALWWQCIRDCHNDTEMLVEVEEVVEPVVIPLAKQPREYVNFIGIERVGKDSRLAWIAYKYYAQKDLWVFIYEANRDIIDNPNLVHTDQHIRIPELEEKWRDLNNPELQQLVDSLATMYLPTIK